MDAKPDKPFQFGIRAVLIWTAVVAALIGLPLYHPILTGVLAYVGYLAVTWFDFRLPGRKWIFHEP